MTGREPWNKPQAHQMAMFVLAGCLGLLLVSPGWMGCWARWDALFVLGNKMQTQQLMTASLRSQTEQIQQSLPTSDLTSVNAPALMALALPSTLEFSRANEEAHVATPQMEPLHVQLLPMRFDVQGSWTAWLGWLDKWHTAAPGVTLSSLTLKVKPQGGLDVQMLAVSPQRMKSDIAKQRAPVRGVPEQVAGDLFDVQRWGHAKLEYVQAHPSYAQQVAPELLRVQEPLERHVREHLHYVGHISFGADVEALIRVHDSPGSKFAEVHRVRVGSHAGQNFGRVSRIDVDHLMLDELMLASSGEWRRQEVRMPLQERMP